MALLSEQIPVSLARGVNPTFEQEIQADPEAARVVVRIPRPTTGGAVVWTRATRLAVTLTAEIDGVRRRCSGSCSGGMRVDPETGEVPEYSLTWRLPVSWDRTLERWKRIGERVQSFRLFVGLELVGGTAFSGTVTVEREDASAPTTPRKNSVAIDATNISSESTGDGELTLDHTAAGTDRAVFCGCSNKTTAGDSSANNSACAYGSTGMTEQWDIVQQLANPNLHIHNAGYTLAGDGNVPASLQTITSTLTLSSDIGSQVLSVISFEGVDPSTPAGTPQTATGLGTSYSIDLSTIGADDFAVLYHAAQGTWDIGSDETGQETYTGDGDHTVYLDTQPGSSGGVIGRTRASGNVRYTAGGIALLAVAAGGETGALAEGAAAGDAWTAQLDAVASLAEGTTAGDTISARADLLADLAEGAVAADAWTRFKGMFADLAEGVAADDSQSPLAGLQAIIAEAAQAGEAWAVTLQAQALLAEGAQAADSWAVVAEGTIEAALAEGTALGAAFVAELAALAALNEAVVAGDAYAPLAALLAALAEGPAVADLWEAGFRLSVALSEGAQAADAWGATVSTVTALDEARHAPRAVFRPMSPPATYRPQAPRTTYRPPGEETQIQ